MTEYGWGIFLIDYIYIHAMDLAGNHSQVGPIALPDHKIEC